MTNRSVAKAEARGRIERILAEAEDRYNNELLPDEERMVLLDRIRRLRKSLAK